MKTILKYIYNVNNSLICHNFIVIWVKSPINKSRK